MVTTAIADRPRAPTLWGSGQEYKWGFMRLISKYLNVINKDIKPLNMFYPLTLKIYLHIARKVRFEFTILGHTREVHWLCRVLGLRKSADTQLA